MSRRGVCHLCNELERVIDYAVAEYHLSVAEVVGVMEVLKHDFLLKIDCAMEEDE